MGRLRDTIVQYRMFDRGQTVLIGVSGGPDSTALLHAMAHLRAEWNLHLIAAHLHHGFRGSEADQDVEYVAQLARQLQVELRVGYADVPALKKRRHLSDQEAAREARRAFLLSVASEHGAERIALAHTRDDRVETVLLNLFRGTGMEGLAGFPPVKEPFVRPFYHVWRRDVEEYCARHQLAPRRDSSNASLAYRRNRIRLELLPYVRAYFNQEVDEAIVRMSDLIAADNVYLDAMTGHTLKQVALQCSDEKIVLSIPHLLSETPGMQRRVLRRAIADLRGGLQNVDCAAIARIQDAVAHGRTEHFTLPDAGGVTVQVFCQQEQVSLARVKPPARCLPYALHLPVPGHVELPSEVGHVACQVYRSGSAAVHALNTLSGQSYGALFRVEELHPPLLVRSVRPGDRMRWRGLGGSRKLQDLFTDAKVPINLRRKLPVVVDNAGQGRILLAGTLRRDITALDTQECQQLEEKIALLSVMLVTS
ncbi:MAG: tRNA lysidine(34) synthetase TilS [Chloroherpetonaceae bacterium]|nr:tRNA lysidine(34) synthetase TilS [Chloroherpetonaceae bacterium]